MATCCPIRSLRQRYKTESHAHLLLPRRMKRSLSADDQTSRRAVLFVGQSYYHAWYVSRELRKLGWRADVLDWEPAAEVGAFFHGEDHAFRYRTPLDLVRQLLFYVRALRTYDVLHFSNAHGMTFGPLFKKIGALLRVPGWDVRLAKRLGKRIVYSNNGCLDGVLQSTFRKWGPEPVCDICPWRDMPTVCSDPLNEAWGKFRNRMADYQMTTGGNRADYNDSPSLHEVPEFYAMDPALWDPKSLVPTNYKLPYGPSTVLLYHAVGNFDRRQSAPNRTIKSTEIYLEAVENLKAEGHDVELIFFKDVPSQQVRYYQQQADIVVDMLTFGWFGANVREAMMLGKPAVTFLRPEWLEQVGQELPEYVRDLPVVSATPLTVVAVLRELVVDAEKRRELGERGRAFALQWHAAAAGARRLDEIYSTLLEEPVVR